MFHSGYVERAIDEHIAAAIALKTLIPVVVDVAETMSSAIERGDKLLFCGNGGSAADAQHLAGEFVGRFMRERRALPALALAANASTLTAVGNDYGFDQVFSRQVQAFGRPGDVLVAISTSGNSANVNQAAEVAAGKGLIVVGLMGRDGGALRALCTHSVVVPADSTPRIQEMHITLGHILCGLVEKSLY